MEILPFPITSDTPPDPGPVGRVVVIYDSFATALQAQTFCEHLAQRFGDAESLDEFFWPTVALEDAAVLREATAAARGADFVVLALRPHAGVGAPLAQWLCGWMPAAAERDITLVLLQDQPDIPLPPAKRVLHFVEENARQAGVAAPYVPSPPDALPFPEAAPSILVVDDDQSLLGAVTDFLADCGYRVGSAADGREAQEIIATQGDTFDLVITDIEMPRLRGDDLAVWLRETHPQLPVLLMSSAAPEAPGTRLLPYVAKPFRLGELLAAIEQIFERVARA